MTQEQVNEWGGEGGGGCVGGEWRIGQYVCVIVCVFIGERQSPDLRLPAFFRILYIKNTYG